MKNAVGYISSNKKNDTERAIELKVQSERIKEFCQKNDLVFAKIYEEPKDSSEDYKTELFKLLDDAIQGKFQHVVVLSLDRISYDTVAKVWVTDELKKKGIKLHSITENLILSPDTDKEVLEKAEKLKEKVRNIPSLPEVVNKVIELVQNPNSSASQIAKIISNDAGLTARVLRLVNSAYYGFPKQIASIQYAIAILGFTTIRGLVLSSSIFRVFAPTDNNVKMLDYKKQWKHSLITAVISSKISKKLKLPSDDNLFSASILHDMGKIILDQYDHGNYILALSDNTDFDMETNLNNEKKYCGLDHCETGHLIAAHWDLPDAIAESIRYHHNPQNASEEFKTMIGVISIANIFAMFYERELEFTDNDLKLIDLNILNINENKIFDLYAVIVDELNEEEDFERFFD